MAEPPGRGPGVEERGDAAPDPKDPADDLASLRSLLIAPEQEQLRALRSRLDDPATHARETSRILPEALALRANDPALAKALAPSIEQSIARSVRRNPRPLADALFPIMGPAIRRAIAQALSGLVESLNTALEHSLSPRALGWRLQAWRTGRPFPEIVLAHTLLFRVEQVFLIHRSTGLLIQHASGASVEVQDASMVSGMLTAIRDFVHDSFGGDEQSSLDTLQVGELTVWVEQGPAAILAAVVRGSAPPELRESLQAALESVHLQAGDDLADFGGDTAAFEPLQPILEDCLRAQYRSPGKAALARWAWPVAALLLLPLAGWAFVSVRDRVRFGRYVERLRAEPGIVVVATGREAGRRVVTGLRDPLAADPAALLAGTGLEPDDVLGRWQLYQALEPALALRRAAAILKPPASASLRLEGDRLVASGQAPATWIRESRALARAVPGVARYDDSALEAGDLDTLARALEASRLYFVLGRAELVDGQKEALARVQETVLLLDGAAQAAGRAIRLRVIGHTDADGPPELNHALSQARAGAIRTLLESLAPAALEIVAIGVGSDPAADAAGRAKQTNRAVSFRVELGRSSEPASAPTSR